jgi:predicted Zn-dependent protease with MMP-like domain
MPVLMTRPEFEDLVAEALDLIPAEFTKAMDNVVILV